MTLETSWQLLNHSDFELPTLKWFLTSRGKIATLLVNGDVLFFENILYLQTMVEEQFGWNQVFI